MSVLDLALQIKAAAGGRALARMGCRHVAVHPDARALTLVALAGEDTDVHAVLFGPLGGQPEVGFVPDPRHRDDLFKLYRWLKDRVEAYYAACRAAGTHPQLWVSSSSPARHLDALADRLRNARADADVRRLGDLLTYAAERQFVAGQQALCAATAVLRLHYATGQQPSEDEHLGALLTWIDPPAGIDVYEAAEAAKLVPMAVHTDPNFDAALLVPLLAAYNKERKGQARPAVLDGIRREIRDAVLVVAQAVFYATGRATDLLASSGLPPLPTLPDLQRAEAEAFEDFMRSRDDGHGIPNRDSHKRAVFGLEARGVSEENYEAAAVLGDPVHRLRAVFEGRVLEGAVRAVSRVRLAPRRFRHLVEVETNQHALRLRPGDELYWADDTRLRLAVRRVRRRGGATAIDLVTVSGDTAAGVPGAGTVAAFVPSVPTWGRLRRARGQLSGRLRAAPWTHTGASPPGMVTRPVPTVDPLKALEGLR